MSGFISCPYILPAASAYSSEATQFFARVSDPGTTRKNTYATMIDALVAGGVWSKLDILYLFAAAAAATALTNLVQSSYGATLSGAPTFTADTDYTNSATTYLDTGFAPSTAPSPHFVQNSAHVSMWCSSVVVDGFKGDAGLGSNTDGQTYMEIRDTNGDTYSDTNSGTADAGAIFQPTANFTAGFYHVNRTSSANTQFYVNGASFQTSGAAASAAPQSGNMGMFSYGPGNNGHTGRKYMAGSVGSGLTVGEALVLYNAVHAYLQTVAGVP